MKYFSTNRTAWLVQKEKSNESQILIKLLLRCSCRHVDYHELSAEEAM